MQALYGIYKGFIETSDLSKRRIYRNFLRIRILFGKQ